MKGTTQSPPMVSFSEIIWSWIGAFLGISLVAFVNYNIFKGTDLVMIIGSFGATAVLIYGAIRSPLAQPRNLIGGHVISAVIGVTTYNLLNSHMWLAASMAVATAIALFGFESGAALATVVGVLIEVPVMLVAVRVVNQSQGWYERREGVVPYEKCCPSDVHMHPHL